MATAEKEWCCNCGAEFDTLKQIIAHYRKDHPDAGAWQLYNQTGDVGDAFMNAGFEECMAMRAEFMNKECADRDAHQKLVELSAKYNRLINALRSIEATLHLAAD